MEDLFVELCSYENLEKAFMKARNGKTSKLYVLKFEKELERNLFALKYELIFRIYKPKLLETFIVRDPKTRKISKSDFRDRVIHHALIRVIEPIFDKTLNYDILLKIIKNKIKDERVLWLIKLIISNHKTSKKGVGMPLGNLTSQFFANVYLNELDQFVKHELKVKYYIRYVDDFVILHYDKNILIGYKKRINKFLLEKLKLELHPDKSNILILDKGIGFLGFRIFFYHKLIKKKNLNYFERKFNKLRKLYEDGIVDREKVIEKLEGWLAYVSKGDTFKYRKNIIKIFNTCFPPPPPHLEKSTKETNYNKKVKSSNIQFSIHKTLYLFKKGLSIKEIAEKREIKEGTVWEHFAKLIEYNQLNVFQTLPKNKVFKIIHNIKNKDDKLKEIKERLNDDKISYDEINCVLAMVKLKSKRKN